MTSAGNVPTKPKAVAGVGSVPSSSEIPAPLPAHPISRSLQNLQHAADSSEQAGRRAGSADTATQKERQGEGRRTTKHRRCQSQSVVPSSYGNGGGGLSVPPPAHYYRSHSATEQGGEITPLVICDEAVSVEEVYGGRGQRLEGLPPRLLVVSSKVRNISVLRHALLPAVTLLQYNHETQSLNDILSSVSQTLNGRQVHSIAFITTCVGPTIPLTTFEDKALSRETVHDKTVCEFFTQLKEEHCSKEASSGMRLDFLACAGFQQAEAVSLAQELEAKLEIPIGVWRDLVGADFGHKKGEDSSSPHASCVAELYFRLERLRSWSGQHQQSLAGFEKIRTVGKGAYGAAVLYKKKDDDSLVILKEINMHDLTAAERQLALNEVRVLAMLDHPNIISYFDSFEEDGVLMIEMEYADGGTLAQYLSQQDQNGVADREREVLTMFQQITAAIRHIHQHNILHRDLKTDNIFLTKEGVVKVGDFGISKMLGSANKGAQTVLGTPYYISPEMCEGKPYSYKSDIWALGCILYEMACLQKTFEGSNLPALVNKIMKGQFAPVKGNFSAEFRDLVSDMLQRDPDLRPSANDIMYSRLPQLMNKFEDPNSDPEDELSASAESISHKVKTRSVLYYLESSTGNLTCINGLPPRMKIRQVGVSCDHVVVVTMEQQVYSWGRGDKGQLGHGDTQSHSNPCLVEALKGKSITMACCGEGFTVFGSDNGLVLTCGDGSTGCLGHGDWSASLKPRLIEALLSVDVVVVACGPRHVAVVGREGEVFCWGQGDRGQLGLGTEDSHCQPMRVEIEEPVVFHDVKCGVDGTMFLTDMGGVFACGSNQYNKLGLNNRQGFLMAMKNIFTKTEVEGRNIPTPVRALARHRVVAIAMGPHHSAVIVEAGHVYTFGRNSEGQLGTGNVKATHTPMELKSLSDQSVNHVQCGEHFMVASTRDHQLFYWGLRYIPAAKPPSSQHPGGTATTDEGSSRSSISSLNAESELLRDDVREEVTPRNVPGAEASEAKTGESANGPDVDEAFPQTAPSGNQTDSGVTMTTGSGEGTDAGVCNSDTNTPGFRPLSETMARRTLSAGSRENGKEKDKDKEKEPGREDCVILFEPVEIIRIKQTNEKVLLSNVFCHGENLFIQVETTAPPPRRRTFKKRSFRRRPHHMTSDLSHDPKQLSTSSHEAGDEYSSEASEIDTQNTIPTWLRDELEGSAEGGVPRCHDNEDDGNEADDTSDLSDDDSPTHMTVDSSLSSIQINRVLTPVKSGDGVITPRPTQPFARGSQLTVATSSSRDRASSINSMESNPDRASAEHTDSSSSETAHAKHRKEREGTAGLSVYHRTSTSAGKTRGFGYKTLRGRSAGRGKARSHEEVLREQLTARGFVSDVTVKRREEALLCELELLREEKKRAETELRALQQEREQQAEWVKQEAERLAQEREEELRAQLEALRCELQQQNRHLEDRQRLVGHLQEQLQQAQQRPLPVHPAHANGHVPPPPTPRPDPSLPVHPHPTPPPSARRGNHSARSNGSASKVCAIQ